MKLSVITIILLVCCVSCCPDKKHPTTLYNTSNPNYQVRLLFEIDGYRVYRFYDKGTFRYFSTPSTIRMIEE